LPELSEIAGAQASFERVELGNVFVGQLVDKL
jgi:hypothetical protein